MDLGNAPSLINRAVASINCSRRPRGIELLRSQSSSVQPEIGRTRVLFSSAEISSVFVFITERRWEFVPFFSIRVTDVSEYYSIGDAQRGLTRRESMRKKFSSVSFSFPFFCFPLPFAHY